MSKFASFQIKIRTASYSSVCNYLREEEKNIYKYNVVTISVNFYTHDDDMGHALERGLFNLGDLILMDAKLLQALWHVSWHFL